MRIKRDYGVIYALLDPRDNKIRYIGLTGRTPNARLGYHIRESRVPSNEEYKNRWIRKLTRLGMKPSIKVLLRAKYDELSKLEIDYISHYRTFCKLTNISDGGDGATGNTWSMEARRRFSEKMTGKKKPYLYKSIRLIDNKTGDSYEFSNRVEAAKFVGCYHGSIIHYARRKSKSLLKGKYKVEYCVSKSGSYSI